MSGVVEIFDGVDLEAEIRENALAKRVLTKLEECYPGWMWSVGIGHGFVEIKAMLLHTEAGYRLYVERVENDVSLACVMRAGGEILERFLMRGGKMREDDLLGAKTLGGRHAFDYHCMARGSEATSTVRRAWDGR